MTLAIELGQQTGELLNIGGIDYELGPEIPLEPEAVAAFAGVQLVVARKLAAEGGYATIPDLPPYDRHEQLAVPLIDSLNSAGRRNRHRPIEIALPKPPRARGRVEMPPVVGHIVMPPSNPSVFEIRHLGSVTSTIVDYRALTKYPYYRVQTADPVE